MTELVEIQGVPVDAYAAAIPSCCAVQDVEGHREMLWCWALLRALKLGIDMQAENGCRGCELNRDECHG